MKIIRVPLSLAVILFFLLAPAPARSAENRDVLRATLAFGERFIRPVQKGRKLNERTLRENSTARLFTADEALQRGLVDKIIYLSDAVKETITLAGLTDDARVVVYRRAKFLDDNYYTMTGDSGEHGPLAVVNIALPESVGPHAGFHDLWPGAIPAE